MSEFEFRGLKADDIPMLHGWLCRPHIAEVWDGIPTVEDVREEYLPTMDVASPVRAYMVLRAGKPFGFIQSYVAAESGDGWWPDEKDPGVTGIDQFIADPNDLDKGLGTAMVRAFVATLFEDPAIVRVQTDPSPGNQRAIRCYENAGFRRVREVITPDGPAVLMYCDGA